MSKSVIEGRGIDGRGASRALATGVVSANGVETTVIKVEGSFNVTGPLETFANAGGIHLARALLAEFAANMARVTAEQAPTVRQTSVDVNARISAPSAQSPATEMHGSTLLWRAFLDWLRHIFSAKGQRGSR